MPDLPGSPCGGWVGRPMPTLRQLGSIPAVEHALALPHAGSRPGVGVRVVDRTSNDVSSAALLLIVVTVMPFIVLTIPRRRTDAHLSRPMIQLESVTKLYGTVIGVNDINMSLDSRCLRAGRSQRIGEDDVAEFDYRPAASHDRECAGAGTFPVESRRAAADDRTLPGRRRALSQCHGARLGQLPGGAARILAARSRSAGREVAG